jgi:two-component system LytT family response regulator
LHAGSATHPRHRRATQRAAPRIADLAEELDESVFCRIHRSTIVKLERTRRLEVNESGVYDVLLDDGTNLRSSRRYRRRLQSLLNARGEGHDLAREMIWRGT